MVMYDIRNGLGVRCGAGSAAPYRVVHLCEFIGDTVGDVGTGGGAGVGAEYDSVGKVDSHAAEKWLESLDPVGRGPRAWKAGGTLRFRDCGRGR